MRKHTEDLPCKVPFCKECLANIKGLANTAKDMMTNPKQAPIETEKLLDDALGFSDESLALAKSMLKDDIKALIESKVLEAMQGIADGNYDDMHGTYDYDGIATDLLYRVITLPFLLTKSKEIK